MKMKKLFLDFLKQKINKMKNDWYLKTVLTVIAIALTVLVLQNANLISTAQANGIPQVTAPMDVRVVDWDANSEVKVDISKCSSRDKINVNVDEVGGWYVSNGVLKVEGK